MPVTARYLPGHEVIETTLTGVVTLADAREEIRLTLELIEQHGSRRILSDCSACEMQISISEAYKLPQIQEDAGSSKLYKIAVIPPASKAGRELVKFYEDVCVNRGWPVRICETRDEALAWLSAD